MFLQVSVTPWGFYVPSYVNGTITGADPTAPQTTDSAILTPSVDIQNAGTQAVGGTALFQLMAPGKRV